MAVSDYRIKCVSDLDRINNELANNKSLEEAIISSSYDNSTKLSSNIDNPVLLMEKTPKIISFLKEKAGNAKLVGFKLLQNVGEKELLITAYNLLVKNNCDYVLANDGAKIKGDEHHAYLLNKNKEYRRYKSKQEIAKGIIKVLTEEL